MAATAHNAQPSSTRDHAGAAALPQVEVSINGVTQTIPAGMTVAGLLAHLGLAARPVAVEVNKTLVPRRDHAATPVQPRDAIELVTLVGGG